MRLGWLYMKLAANGKSKNSGRQMSYRPVPSPISKMAPVCRASDNRGRQRGKGIPRLMETENLETGRKAKHGTGSVITKTGILEYNMTGMLTDEKRYENSDTKEWNDINFKRRSITFETKIGNLTVSIHNTSEISGTKLGKKTRLSKLEEKKKNQRNSQGNTGI